MSLVKHLFFIIQDTLRLIYMIFYHFIISFSFSIYIKTLKKSQNFLVERSLLIDDAK